jgi:hypothetical protein
VKAARLGARLCGIDGLAVAEPGATKAYPDYELPSEYFGRQFRDVLVPARRRAPSWIYPDNLMFEPTRTRPACRPVTSPPGTRTDRGRGVPGVPEDLPARSYGTAPLLYHPTPRPV